MPIDIRPVDPDEHEEAGRVTAAAYREFWEPGHPDWDEYLARLADVGSRSRHARVLVAVEDGRVLGSVTLELDHRIPGGHPRQPLAQDEAHVRMLAVDPSTRRRGVGTLLMEACAKEARRAGKTRITLGTTPLMKAARRLYESMGFRRGPDEVFDDGFRLLTYELKL